MRYLSLLLPAALLLGAGTRPALAARSAPYDPQVTGAVVGYRLAGIEPDGDPLDQVVLQTRLSPSRGFPSMHLIVDAYLENFTPDTTPILPDLLHRNRTAQNLGGFLQGKALLTDDAGNALYIGSFLAEAFLDNSNHAVMALDGTGAARGGHEDLAGIFHLHKGTSSVGVQGSFRGHLSLPAAARRQIVQHTGARMKPVQQIIGLVTVHPAPMMGRNTRGNPNARLHTGYGSPTGATTHRTSSQGRTVSPLTLAAAAGAVLCFLLAGVLFWTGRKRQEEARPGSAPS